MRLKWTQEAVADLDRLRAFLEPKSPRAALATAKALYEACRVLPQQPRLGSRLREFEPREVRRRFVRDYEVRYEIRDDTVFVLRLWHAREDR